MTMKALFFQTFMTISLMIVPIAAGVHAAPGDKQGGNNGPRGGNAGQAQPRGNQGAPRGQSGPNVQSAPQTKAQVTPQVPKVVAPQTPRGQVAPQTPSNLVPAQPNSSSPQNVAPRSPGSNSAAPQIRLPNAGNDNNPNNSPATQPRRPFQEQSDGSNSPAPNSQIKNPLKNPRTNDVAPPQVDGSTPSQPNAPNGQPQSDFNRSNTFNPNRVDTDPRNRANDDVRNRDPNRVGGNNDNDGRRNDIRPNYPRHSWYRGHWNGVPGGRNNPQFNANARLNGSNFGYGGFGYGGYGGNNFGVGGGSNIGNLIRIGLALSGNGGFGSGFGGNIGPGYGGYGLIGGYPVGWGYGGYGLGRIAYSSGYFPYNNPYYVQGGGYNYSQPIPIAVATNDAPTDSQLFDAAVAQFKNGDYGSALTTIDSAIQQNGSDPAMHEFRALVLFAQGDYGNAAATIHSVLAVGPGWNWETLSSLYDDVDVYTRQFRMLEQASKNQSEQADLRFLLAYHYLATDNIPEAVVQLRKVTELSPKDRLAADLLKMNDYGQTAQVAPDANPSTTAAAPEPKSVDPAALVGQWTAHRGDDSNFEFKLASDKTFTWKVDQQGRTELLKGTYEVEKNLLALESDQSGGMVGQVSLDGNDQFRFKVLGAPTDDEGLSFKKQ